MISEHLEAISPDALIRFAKMLRPRNELERMTAIAEDALFRLPAKYHIDNPFGDLNTCLAELTTYAWELNILEIDFVKAIDVRDREAKGHLETNGCCFREAEFVFLGVTYYPKTRRVAMWELEYVKSRVLRGLFIRKSDDLALEEDAFERSLALDAFAVGLELVIVGESERILEDIICEDTQHPQAPSRTEPDAEADAFIAEIDALLAEDDDTLTYEDRLPKAAPTG